ncbi:MAG: HIT family protein [Rhizobiales bacterium 65-9]|nr:MAG: HIT family protein [Rhizobiales bacterium 65-9]
MEGCLFCQIAAGDIPSHWVYEDDALLAFLDIAPVREGHSLIIPKAHHRHFDDLPADLAARIIQLGQRLARTMKPMFGVARVGFLFTGNDVDHAHGHVIPMREKDDLTSRRYIAEEVVTYRNPPQPPRDEMARVASALRDALRGPV